MKDRVVPRETIYVEPMNEELETSPILQPSGADCIYNGETYSEGSVICLAGFKYMCVAGVWSPLGSEC